MRRPAITVLAAILPGAEVLDLKRRARKVQDKLRCPLQGCMHKNTCIDMQSSNRRQGLRLYPLSVCHTVITRASVGHQYCSGQEEMISNVGSAHSLYTYYMCFIELDHLQIHQEQAGHHSKCEPNQQWGGWTGNHMITVFRLLQQR